MRHDAMRFALRKLVLLVAAFLGVLLVVGMPTWGQEAVEPSGELADAECYGHHKQEGFRSMDLFPMAVSEIPKATEFTFELVIKNPWLHELRNVQGYVNISSAPGISFPGAKEPVTTPFDGTIAAQPNTPTVGSPHKIPVEANATEILVTLVANPDSLPPAVAKANDFELSVESPDGSIKIKDEATKPPATPTSPGRKSQLVRVDQTNVTRVAPGDWKALVTYTGVSPSVTYKLTATVYYNLSKSQEFVVNGPAVLKPNEQHTFTFTVNARDVEALQMMRYGGRSVAYHEHTDKAIGDDGTYDKWNTVEFKTGAQLVVGKAEISAANVSLLEPVLRRWGQVLGFAASFLIIPSLVFGGTFGRKSVDWLNPHFGGARRRVLFHNAMSFWLLGISVLHMFLYFYEAFWNWSHGLVWGGLSLAAMVGLGVTGATQRTFVARWGFTRWRFVHFAMGILVVVFVLIHMTADGSHLAPIREMFFGKDPSRVGV